MKQTIRTSRTAGLLEKIFRACNEDMFNNELPEAIITIQSTPKAYGHLTINQTWSAKDEPRYELNIGAGTLDRHIEETVGTMIHEMVHLYCIVNGIKDTSRNGTYHNKRFKEEAEKRLLHIDHDDRIGWSLTTPTDELIEYVLSKGWEDIDMNRDADRLGLIFGTGGIGRPTPGKPGTPISITPKKSSTRKYQCPCCHNSVRATKNVNIMCMDCQEQMIIV